MLRLDHEQTFGISNERPVKSSARLLRKLNRIYTDHRHSIQLSQRSHGFEQYNYKATAFYGFYRAGEKVRSDRLEVLQYTHSVRVPQNLMALLVVPAQD